MGVASRPETPAHTHPAMDTVTIKDSLKGELLGDRKLRPTEAAEKNVLPSAEDVQTEKKHQSILNGIEAFTSDQLRHAETKEKISLPRAEEIQTERTILGLLQGVADFEAETLRTVKTREPASPSSIVKTVLAPDSSLTAVNEFDKTCLKKAETAEKIRCRHQKPSRKKWSILSSRSELKCSIRPSCHTQR